MSEKHELKDYRGKNVLVVDDDIDLLQQLKAGLEKMGFTVTVSETQTEAEKLIAANSFDLAVIDLMLEHKDSGFVLNYRLKKKNPEIPIIVVTSVASDTGINFEVTGEESKEWVNADVILHKDIRLEQLEGEIHRLL
jgi:DNA-binding response OmpR family regulator